jgi:hypothetical protein
MKRLFFLPAFALALCLAGCGGSAGSGPVVLDAGKAIDDPRRFDISEIASEIDFVPLESALGEGLVGEIRKLAATSSGFVVLDRLGDRPVTLFDGEGRFLSTRGNIGRGPDEFTGVNDIAFDEAAGNLYLIGMQGSVRRLMGYDASGRLFASADSVRSDRIAFHEGALVSGRDTAPIFSSGSAPEQGGMVPFLEVYSPELQRLTTLEVADKGTGGIIRVVTEGTNVSVSILKSSPGVLSGNGNSLLVKEGRGDTLKRYAGGALTPAFVLDFGGYTPPAEAFGYNPAVDPGNSYSAQNVLEGAGYIFVSAHGYEEATDVQLVFREEEPSGGFMATGAGGEGGLRAGGIAFTPCYIREGRLVGWASALDILDNADAITDARLKALAATLKEDSNPVVVIARLR